jgi:hypothetical protein
MPVLMDLGGKPGLDNGAASQHGTVSQTPRRELVLLAVLPEEREIKWRE